MTRLLRALGNEGAVRNVKADIDRQAAVLAHLETMAARLALVDTNTLPMHTVVAHAA
jgi:hypothetical protein